MNLAVLGVAGTVGMVSWGLGGAAWLMAWAGWGWGSPKFMEDLGGVLLGGIFAGKGKIMESFGCLDEFGGKLSESPVPWLARPVTWPTPSVTSSTGRNW